MSEGLAFRLVALVGPPNAGKTTLFNALTGSLSHPVNYPGATVEYAVGPARRHLGTDLQFADTPGTYSLSPKSPEEKVTYDILYANVGSPPTATVVVVDGTQLSRHLPLARQILETGYPTLIVVTMKDLLDRDGMTLDCTHLSKLMGAPVLLVNSLDGKALIEIAKAARNLHFSTQPKHNPQPWSAARMTKESQWAAEIAAKVVTQGPPIGSQSTAEKTRQLDRIFLHPFWGLVLFVVVMGLLFTSIFWVAAPAMNAITYLFSAMAQAVLTAAPGHLWADFIAGGLILSLGAILTFVPQIMMLFLGITLLEDSGYLARAATLIDRPLTRIGLNGRSFVPLLSGYACAIPAMLAARNIPNRKERWVTLFVIPLMSCSARLPVYSLLLAFLFWGEPAWKPGATLAVVYFISLVMGALAASIANRMIRAEDRSFFMMELPFYRRPSMRAILKTMLLRTESYLRKAGPAIMVFALVLWSATTFPNYHAPSSSEKLNTSYAADAGKFINPLMQPMGGDWRTGVALISAFAAREVFVSSLGLVLQVSEGDETSRQVSLLDSMRTATREDGSKLFTTASVIGLILFFMIALQCMSTVAVARREFGNWKYPLLQLTFFNVFAYLLAVGVVQGLRFAGVA